MFSYRNIIIGKPQNRPKFTKFSSSNVEWVVVDGGLFLIFELSIPSGDIRNQSQQLSKIAPKFGRFFAIPNFRRRAFDKLYPCYHPYIATLRLEKFREGISTSPRSYRGAHAEF